MSYRFDVTDSSGRSRGLARAATVLAEGELVVLPTESAYGLAADAFSVAGLAALRRAKDNPGLAPVVLIGSLRTLDGLVTQLAPSVRALAEAFWPGGLTLICPVQPSVSRQLGGPDGAISVRMPLHPVALHLLASTGPLVLTAANTPGQPPPLSYDEAQAQLGDLVSVYLDGGPVGVAVYGERFGAASTVVDGRGDVPTMVRAGSVELTALVRVAPAMADPERTEDQEASA